MPSSGPAASLPATCRLVPSWPATQRDSCGTSPPNQCCSPLLTLVHEMLRFALASRKTRPIRILCLGAHSDDIEIGCGGTILRLLSEYDDVEVHWVVLGSSGPRDGEALAGAEKFLAKAKKKEIMIE